MSKKRISPESSTDEQTTEGSDSVFQEDVNAKRSKLTALSDTTLQDLPIELIECILVKVVAMEVKGMKLAKSVWKEKADLVIDRLRTVCSQWDSILTSTFFQNQLNRTLDGTAQETIRMEIVQQYSLQFFVFDLTTMRDEIFLLYIPKREDYSINVYNCNNMTAVKAVIPLPGLRPKSITACSVSNCVYVLNRKLYNHVSVLSTKRDNDHWSTVSILISEMCLPESRLCVAANGSLILSRQQSQKRAAISVFDANGSFLKEIRLSSDISAFWNMIPKSNGNLVVVSVYNYKIKLTEIDLDGIMIHEYQSSLGSHECISHADNYGRMLLTDDANRMELLDSEFNPVEFTGLLLGVGQSTSPFSLHYISERNEIIATVCGQHYQNFAFIIFHLKEI